MGKMQNLVKSPDHSISYTFFDALFNLCEEFEQLTADGRPHLASEVVNAFSGNSPKRFQTLVHIARLSMRLFMSSIRTRGENFNIERADIVLKNSYLNRAGLQTVEKVFEEVDCRVYKNFLTISTFQNASSFLSEKSKLGERAQNYALLKGCDLHRKEEYRSTQHFDLAKVYEAAIDALVAE